MTAHAVARLAALALAAASLLAAGSSSSTGSPAPTVGEYVAVRFTKAPIRPVGGPRFLVRQSDAKACEGFRAP
jgi:hypothetical protein